ncbi:tetratricopeptide repeat protein, partial [Streptomyces sp. NPDC002688]|uniref:tetratricopeptide repeat protein n=1 Tax=Streptomyces sp. NPDC002688 TaxID=3154423 RepID=UPI00332CFDAC
MSLRLLEQRGLPLARPLLRLIATFADAPLPYTLLLTPRTLADAGEVTQLDGPGVWTLLTALAGLGLVDLQPTTGSDALPVLRVHPLVRDASLDPAALGTAVQALHSAAFAEETGMPEEPNYWEHWALLQPHALDLFHRVAGSEPPDQTIVDAAASAADLAARFLLAKGLYGQARDEFEAILAHQPDILGDTHPETLSTLHELARVLHGLGELGQARDEFEAILAHQRDTLGDTHPDTLSTRYNLARALHDLGKLEQARDEFEAILAHERDTLGDTHPHTLITLHELARVLHDLGKLEQARREYEAILAHQRDILGDTHPHTLITLHELARVLHDLGELEPARREYEAILAHQRDTLGDTHPDTLSTRYNLARALHD